MNDLEKKLRDTPLRQPAANLRGDILAAAEKSSGENSAAPRRLFESIGDELPRRASRPWLAFLLRPATIFVLLVLLVVTCGAALIVATNSAGGTAWERYVAEAKARGVKMSLKEMLPAPIPDAENFAAVPIFADLFSDDEAVRKKAGEAFNFPDSGYETRPKLASLCYATRCDLAAWQAAFVKSGDLSAPSADAAADVLRALDHRFGPALAKLAEAEARPGAVFPVHWEKGFYAALPHLGLMQAAARIHHLRLSAHLARGDTAGAYAEFRGLLRQFRALENEPALISGLVRVSILKIAVDGVWEGVVNSTWDSVSLEKIAGDVSAIDLLADFQFSLASERAGMNDGLDDARVGKLSLADIEGTSESDSGRGLLLRAVPKIPGWISVNQLAMNRFFDQASTKVNVTTARFEDQNNFDAEMREIDRSIFKRHIFVVYRTLAPALSSFEHTFLRGQTALNLARVACALEHARLAEGAFPQTLDSLVPRYIAALPHDVMNGEPLHYRRTPDGKFVLYSVGSNGVDDGGVAGEKGGVTSQLDWVWRWPAPTP